MLGQCLVLALAACGDGGGGGGGTGGGLLAGDPSAPALGALVNLEPQPAAPEDIVDGLILTRLDVVIVADATVGQVNAALGAVGATIAAMRAGVPALTAAIPRQDGPDAMQALAEVLQAQPGIRLVLLPREAELAVAPPAPANSEANLGYLQQARFPAAWNARGAVAGLCVNDKVTVIVADMFHRPIDSLYAEFAAQVPGVTNLGIGSVDETDLTGHHGYDVLATLAADLDATAPTGANPFPDCLDLRAVQIIGLSPYEISLAIDFAVAATTGKSVLNASYAFADWCGDPVDGILCTATNLHAPRALERAGWGALQRALLSAVDDRVLLTSAAGNHASDPVTMVYPGAGQARVGSALNVAATADSTMSFVTETALWEPTVPCTTPPCLPSLGATPAERGVLDDLLAELAQTSAPPSDNVMIVGSIDTSFNPSDFSEPGADVFAVGEDVPTLLGVVTQGTSVAAPQVAGLAAYLWMLSPDLRARPVQDTIAAIEANASADGIIDAYATVLSLDESAEVTPATARMRLAILDVDEDGDFDLVDLQEFHDAYVDSGLVLNPTSQDYSRFDLNGDGFTGGTRATRMDLDPTGSIQFGQPALSEVGAVVGGIERTFNEISVTDARALCYYANTALFTGDVDLRDALLADLCIVELGATLSGELTFSSHVATPTLSLDMVYAVSVTAQVSAQGAIDVSAVTGTGSETYTYVADAAFNCAGGVTATGRPPETTSGDAVGGSGLGIQDGDPLADAFFSPNISGTRTSTNCDAEGAWTTSSRAYEGSFESMRGTVTVSNGMTTFIDFNQSFTDDFGTTYTMTGVLQRQ